ncbi:unnamed protein product [Dovyalis caffra]|uniref:RRM domain-containing protein n=1 Tax=Dovyalis caffra TaxID=77055 RepID=A0AAV1R323_9ROSI|nr:unnamed protein product [Dovyalis caffra]
MIGHLSLLGFRLFEWFDIDFVVQMAFPNKLGSLVRQSLSQNGQVPMASMLNTIRCMSSSRLFVGGLAWATDDQTLRDAFANFGEVTDARVVTDRDTGRSRGFGFVSFESNKSADEALSAMDGQVRNRMFLREFSALIPEFYVDCSTWMLQDLGGRNIRVSYANERKPFNNSYSQDQGFSGYFERGGLGDVLRDERWRKMARK